MAQESSRTDALEESVERVAGLLARLIGQAVLFNELVGRAIGVSAIDLQTFGVISRHDGPITPTQVATRTGLPASTITRVLDRLENAGYIVRSAVPTDRRKVAVEVVDAKAAQIARHYAGKLDQIRALHSTRTDAELATVASYLADLVTAEATPPS